MTSTRGRRRLYGVLLAALVWALPLPAVGQESASPPAVEELESPEGISSRAYRSELERAWVEGGSEPAARAAAARKRGLELGFLSIETPARALLLENGSGPELSNGRLAVMLAPRLPLAHVALARTLWEEGEYTGAAFALWDALVAIPRNLEASLWLGGSLLAMFAAVVSGASLVFMVLTGLSVGRVAAHDLGDLVSRDMPEFARVALLGCLLLLPLWLGEGLLGFGLGLFAAGVAFGTASHRKALALAAVLLVLGLYPLARFAGSALLALETDAVALAALSVATDTESPAELSWLERFEDSDPLAQHALAVRARRKGDLEDATARYTRLAEVRPDDAVVLNNMANLRFLSGDVNGAIDLYERAQVQAVSPVLLFNLSQAYGRAIRVEDLRATLERAQAASPALLGELSRPGDANLVADLPIPPRRLRQRFLSADTGEVFAHALRAPVAPGWLGRGWPYAAGAFAGVFVLMVAVSGRWRHSGTCMRCGTRLCARCHGTVWSGHMCDGCHRLFQRAETTNAKMRMTRLKELRVRERRRNQIGDLLSFAVPGTAGLLARRPDLAYVAIVLCGWVLVSAVWRHGVVPDPLTLGVAGSLAFLLTSAVAAVGYTIVLAVSLAARRNL
ncbi:MAG: hypothetical protein MJE66_08640 [Proteobacteria bacterium]|nr:hypothetical protein [Pseudomonadota bacterium]